jgi:glycosyltransferase involved in cell wall biosynthesis
MDRVLFYRDFHGFTGGHLKVWNYFNHTLQSENYQPYISFTPNSLWDSTNPWSLFPQQIVRIGKGFLCAAGETFTSSHQVVENLSGCSINQNFDRNGQETITSVQPVIKAPASSSRFNSSRDILFLAGLDWRRLPEEQRRNSPVPIINLIQGFRHTDPDHPCYEFLQYPAIRICVSQEIKAAIEATGRPKGEIFVIPNGIDLEKFMSPNPGDRSSVGSQNLSNIGLQSRPHKITIVALKQPELARQLKSQLQATYPEIQPHIIDSFLPRHEFLQCLGTSQITIFLPLATEGFYLPALEGMAAGTLVICPDCVGNRSFCLDNWNCWRPEYKLANIFQAVEQALTSDPSQRQEIQHHAQLTVAKHDLIAERRAFLEILAKASQLWQEL